MTKDGEFIFINKISHILNCSPRETPNYFESQGIEYLCIPWEETDQQILFDQQGHTLGSIVAFINKATSRGESVLVHSLRGQSRASCAICAYFMVRYKWGFYKTLEFLDSRRPDLEIRRNFFDQLKFLAERIAATEKVSDNWDQILSLNPEIRAEEIVLKNTFFNSKLEEHAEALEKKKGMKPKKKKTTPEKKKKKIKWVDEGHRNRPLETDVFAPTIKGPKPLFNPGHMPERSILKCKLEKEHDKKVHGDNSLLDKREVSSAKHQSQSSANRKDSSLGQRPKSSAHQSHDDSYADSEIDSAAKAVMPEAGARLGQKRLLNEDKSKIVPGANNTHRKPPLALQQSNSFKRLDSAKPKRGETPRRREGSEKEKKRTSESLTKNKDELSGNHTPTSYVRPPTAKKPQHVQLGGTALDHRKTPMFDPLAEKILRDNSYLLKQDPSLGDSGLRESSDLNTSGQKKQNKSEVEEKDHIGQNISKNSTNLPDDSRDNKRREVRESPQTNSSEKGDKLSKVGPLQPRYDSIKANSRLTAFTTDITPPPRPSSSGGAPPRPPSVQPKDIRDTISTPVSQNNPLMHNSQQRRQKDDFEEENDSKHHNTIDSAFRSAFLGKDTLIKPGTHHNPNLLGLASSTHNPNHTAPSRAVRANRNLLDDVPASRETPGMVKKRTLLLHDQKPDPKVGGGNLVNGVVASSNRRPNSAPLKDKDKLNNPKKVLGQKQFEPDLYATRNARETDYGGYSSIIKGVHPSEQGRFSSALGKQREPAAIPSNSIYKGPVIKKRVLN